jgi:GABA permease
MKHYLVVANQTLGGDRLMEEVRRRIAEGPCSFSVVVPNTRPPDLVPAAVGWLVPSPGGASASDDDGQRATQLAQARLHQALNQLQAEGIQAHGELGDPDPLTAIADALAGQQFDEIIISTLPSGISRWLGMDLPHRAEQKFRVPVTTITPAHHGA